MAKYGAGKYLHLILFISHMSGIQTIGVYQQQSARLNKTDP